MHASQSVTYHLDENNNGWLVSRINLHHSELVKLSSSAELDSAENNIFIIAITISVLRFKR
ncbi:hypothetical protein T4B_9582 [Trichinella pseudospiralis]|uniref:Uncharacterized protein n=1 Tax=Trichinella pseudospiralis TaxID=6337 RepID=A0A0V1IG34_TRIPS|nr:hypothetical protein T4B_9582 [Trichinella pseudospiralis]